MTAAQVPRPWQTYLRFTMRGMIVLVLVIGGGLGWLVRAARIHRGAGAAVARSGGWLVYDWESKDHDGQVWGEPEAPPWLVQLLGAEYAANIIEVRLGVRGTDAAIAPVARLEWLQTLRLSHTPVTDTGLARLSAMSRLATLDLAHTHITDAGLVHLEGLTNLSELDLSFTQVTDVGLARLNGLNRLSILNLSGTKVSNAGIVHLKAISNLRELDLYRTRVTDTGMTELEGALPNLKITR